MIRVSDYVMDFLNEQGVGTVFMLSGGGIMHLVDSLGKSGMGYVCCHHEQACSIAAQAYAMYKNSLGVCLVTTGPGGTNALTGAAAAYMDSTPVLFISGQVKRSDFASLRGVRQYGAQENDIISMVKPITKYAVTVTEAREIKYHLQKAVYSALEGRRGPVWLDIPLDVQSENVDVKRLRGYAPNDEKVSDGAARAAEAGRWRELACRMLKESSRPLIIAGHGVISSGSAERLRKLQKKLGLPMMSSWRALEIMDGDDPLFFGSPGLQAARYSNIITQGADLLIIIGTRLDNMITAYNGGNFGIRAKKLVVDIDENELKKLELTCAEKICCDAGDFIEAVLNADLPPRDYSKWLDFCARTKAGFPLLSEKQAKELGGADLYKAAEAISRFCEADDALVFSSTSRCNTAGHIAFRRKKGQKSVSSMGLGSMGFALPSAVGAYFASGGKRTVVLEGDGSLQLNIQELQTIRHYGVDAKMFIFSNGGYAAIKTMQDRSFKGLHVGCTSESGVSLPSLEKIAETYGMPYLRADKNESLDAVIGAAMRENGAVICELVGDIDFDEIPKCISSVDAEGKITSAALENPYPFLTARELEEIYSELRGDEEDL